MNILITGGAGFIGCHLAKALASDHHVKVFDDGSRSDLSSIANLPAGVDRWVADILNVAELRKAMRGAEIVYHLAALSNVRAAQGDVARAYRVNTHGTGIVLTTAKACGVRRVVFTSSREVYGEPAGLPVPESAPLLPKNIYGLTKAAAETCCRMVITDLEIVILRLANVYGIGDLGRVIPIFARKALQGLPIKLYGGDQILDFVWIDDVVRVLVAAGEGVAYKSLSPLNVGSGTGVTISELAERIVNITGKKSPLQYCARRTFEVSRFVADTGKSKLASLTNTGEPLDGLSRVVTWIAQLLASDKAQTPTLRRASKNGVFS